MWLSKGAPQGLLNAGALSRGLLAVSGGTAGVARGLVRARAPHRKGPERDPTHCLQPINEELLGVTV